MPEDLSPPVSPCVKNCVLDANGYCRGCYRTIGEIARWQKMSHPEQRALLRDLSERARAQMVSSD
jgi:uncharacterized protein